MFEVGEMYLNGTEVQDGVIDGHEKFVTLLEWR